MSLGEGYSSIKPDVQEMVLDILEIFLFILEIMPVSLTSLNLQLILAPEILPHLFSR